MLRYPRRHRRALGHTLCGDKPFLYVAGQIGMQPRNLDLSERLRGGTTVHEIVPSGRRDL